jgi:hypothetical protein
MALNVIVTILYVIDIQINETYGKLGGNMQISFEIERVESDSNYHKLNALARFQNN